MHACMYVCIYIYTYIHTYMYSMYVTPLWAIWSSLGKAAPVQPVGGDEAASICDPARPRVNCRSSSKLLHHPGLQIAQSRRVGTIDSLRPQSRCSSYAWSTGANGRFDFFSGCLMGLYEGDLKEFGHSFPGCQDKTDIHQHHSLVCLSLQNHRPQLHSPQSLLLIL